MFPTPIPEPLLSSRIPGAEPDHRGKVRDIYSLGDRMVLVATDRVSAYDVVLPTGIPGKGIEPPVARVAPRYRASGSLTWIIPSRPIDVTAPSNVVYEPMTNEW